MDKLESVETLNKRLIEHFGIDTSTSQPIWRIVFSDEQFERRFGLYEDYTPNGLFIRSVREVRYVPKYRQWIQHKYVVEQLVVVPTVNVFDLPDTKVSYEPLWVFEDRNGNPLPPKWEAAKFIIDTVNAAKNRNHNLAKYKDPDSDEGEAKERHRQKIESITEELFGDESGLLGTTITGESIIVPQSYEKVTK